MADWIVQRSSGLMEVEAGAEVLALHIEQGTCYGFNSTATEIWKLIDRPRRLSELLSLLAEKFNVAPEICEPDVRELLRNLEQDGMVSIDASSS